jgi:hypothetical protein
VKKITATILGTLLLSACLSLSVVPGFAQESTCPWCDPLPAKARSDTTQQQATSAQKSRQDEFQHSKTIELARSHQESHSVPVAMASGRG